MAIALVTSGSLDGSFNNAGDPVTTSVDAGTASERLILAHAGWHSASAHTVGDSAFQYNGVTMTAGGATVSVSSCSGRLFHLVNPAANSNTLSCDPSSGAGTNNAIVSWAVFSGVDQTTPVDGYTSGNGTDTTAELTITSASGDVVVYFLIARCLTPTGIAPTNYTERQDNVHSNLIASVGDAAGAGSVAMTGTISATAVNGWVTLGCNLNAAAAGGVTGTGAGNMGAQTFAGAGVERMLGGIASTQAAQTAAAAALERMIAASASSQASCTGSGSGLERMIGTSGATQAPQTGAGAGVERMIAAGVCTQAPMTCSSSGTVTSSGVAGAAVLVMRGMTCTGTGFTPSAVTYGYLVRDRSGPRYAVSAAERSGVSYDIIDASAPRYEIDA